MQRNNAVTGSRADSSFSVEEWPHSKAAQALAPGLASLQRSPGRPARAVPKAEVRLYRRRWVVLFLFSAVSGSNAFMWLQFGIISNIFMRFYAVSSQAIDCLAIVYLLTYVPLVLPVLWFLDRRGMREVVLVGSAFNCIGAWVKAAGASPGLFPVAFCGQFVCSVATVFVLGIPSHLASVWFGEKEVSTACSIGVLGNQVGLKRFPP